jgi:LysM repeat protein
MKKLLVLLIVISLAFSATLPAYASDTGAVLSLVNQARSNAGLTPLTMNSLLVNAAQRHSNDMAAGNFLSHTGSDGSSVGNRITQTGYSWSSAGENILYRFDESASGAFNQWWNSPPHQANMMNATYCDIGIAHTYNSSAGRWYYTMVLGRQSGQTCTSSGTTTGSSTTGATSSGSGSGGTTTGGNTTGGSTTGTGSGTGQVSISPPALASGGSQLAINGRHPAAPAYIYCTAPGYLTVYAVPDGQNGVLAFTVTDVQAAEGLTRARTTGSHVSIGQGPGTSLYALTSYEYQLVATNRDGTRYDFIFPISACPLGNGGGGNTTAIPTTVSSPNNSCIHLVRRGENLFRISLRYNVTIQALASANNIVDIRRIYAGQSLIIPGCNP